VGRRGLGGGKEGVAHRPHGDDDGHERRHEVRRLAAIVLTGERATEPRGAFAADEILRAHGIGEDEAYARLRQTAMNEKRKIADIAQSLVTAAPLLEK
jgi:AmiR/NasT family two-component response regulator